MTILMEINSIKKWRVIFGIHREIPKAHSYYDFRHFSSKMAVKSKISEFSKITHLHKNVACVKIQRNLIFNRSIERLSESKSRIIFFNFNFEQKF